MLDKGTHTWRPAYAVKPGLWQTWRDAARMIAWAIAAVLLIGWPLTVGACVLLDWIGGRR